jgi:hypothetical protein
VRRKSSLETERCLEAPHEPEVLRVVAENQRRIPDCFISVRDFALIDSILRMTTSSLLHHSPGHDQLACSIDASFTGDLPV